MALCRWGAIFENLIALIGLSSPPVFKKKRSFVHPDLKPMAYFIASKCFAAKTGFPNRSCEVGGSELSDCGRSSSSSVLTADGE